MLCGRKRRRFTLPQMSLAQTASLRTERPMLRAPATQVRRWSAGSKSHNPIHCTPNSSQPSTIYQARPYGSSMTSTLSHVLVLSSNGSMNITWEQACHPVTSNSALVVPVPGMNVTSEIPLVASASKTRMRNDFRMISTDLSIIFPGCLSSSVVVNAVAGGPVQIKSCNGDEECLSKYSRLRRKDGVSFYTALLLSRLIY